MHCPGPAFLASVNRRSTLWTGVGRADASLSYKKCLERISLRFALGARTPLLESQAFGRERPGTGEAGGRGSWGQARQIPRTSLKPIFLPWVPEAYATAEQRLQMLDAIMKRFDRVSWNLLTDLAPRKRA
jgi:hypothetical protein